MKKFSIVLIAVFLMFPAMASAVGNPVSQTVTISGPNKVVDENTVTLTATVTQTMDDGTAVPQQTNVNFWSSSDSVNWSFLGTVPSDNNGNAIISFAPRTTVTVKATVDGFGSVPGVESSLFNVENLPPRAPVDLPRGAPNPRVGVPVQPRADGPGANAVISRIPNDVWSNMRGRSWHRGCPVGRRALRMIKVNYYGYDGYRYRGELIANRRVAHKVANTFSYFHNVQFPVRSIVRPDYFGWSRRVKGADDYASMEAGNTYLFNCRWVVGRPGVRSPHSWGRSLDLNTWENPYYSRQDGWVPNSWWVYRDIGWLTPRSREAWLVQTMRQLGWSWTYGMSDMQHFEG